MCLIVYYPDVENCWFDEEDFETSYESNSDGIGIMYANNGRVRVHKSMGEFAKQKRLWRSQVGIRPFAMHQRMRTHGETDMQNVHPYPILTHEQHGYDLYMMHNGIINVPEYDSNLSDTWHFVEYYLRPILETNHELWLDPHFQDMVEDFIGYGSKLLFMNGDGRVRLYNEKKGTWKNGCWLSNTYSIARVSYSSYFGFDDDWPRRSHQQSKATPPAWSHLDDEFEAITSPYGSNSNTASQGEAEVRRLPHYSPSNGAYYNPSTGVQGSIAALAESTDDDGAEFFLPQDADNTGYSVDQGLTVEDIAMSLSGLRWDEIRDWIEEDPEMAADFVEYALGRKV